MPNSERREQLIAAAARVISREGVTGATTRRIAQEAGAPLASLHYTFGNKEELFTAVIDFGVEQTSVLIAERAGAPGRGLITAVTEYLKTYRSWAIAEPDLMIAQFALLTWLLRSPAGKRHAGDAYGRYRTDMQPVLAAAAGKDESDVDLNALAELAIAVSDGLIMQLVTIGPTALASIAAEDIAAGLVHSARRSGRRRLVSSTGHQGSQGNTLDG